MNCQRKSVGSMMLRSNVVDPCRSGTDTDPDSDPDPAFSSVADKMPTKNKCLSEDFFFAY